MSFEVYFFFLGKKTCYCPFHQQSCKFFNGYWHTREITRNHQTHPRNISACSLFIFNFCLPFQVNESFPFSINLTWKGLVPDSENGGTESQQSAILFPKGNVIPCTKVLTLFRSGTFAVDAVYAEESTKICTYTVNITSFVQSVNLLDSVSSYKVHLCEIRYFNSFTLVYYQVYP